jgi:hypothetical protein
MKMAAILITSSVLFCMAQCSAQTTATVNAFVHPPTKCAVAEKSADVRALNFKAEVRAVVTETLTKSQAKSIDQIAVSTPITTPHFRRREPSAAGGHTARITNSNCEGNHRCVRSSLLVL